MRARRRTSLVTVSVIVALAIVSASLALSAARPFPAAAATDRWVGYYVPGAPHSMTPLTTLESRTGQKAHVVLYYQDLSGGFAWTPARNAVNHGSIPLITLEFWNPAKGVNQPYYSLQNVIDGKFDAYLHAYARSAKSFGKTIWLRPFHEMNGTWYPWGGTVNGNSAARFGTAWRRVRSIFRVEGATNVKFVWSPNAISKPDNYVNSIGRYWPGDQYVDLIALDGYNFGGTGWTWFGGVFWRGYAAVNALPSKKPIFIGETACSSSGGDKSVWIRDMFWANPNRYPRMVGVVWFNANKERDWRIESSWGNLSSFKASSAGF